MRRRFEFLVCADGKIRYADFGRVISRAIVGVTGTFNAQTEKDCYFTMIP